MCKGSTIHTHYLGLKNYFSHPRGTFMIEVALKNCNAKSYSGNYFLCAIASMSLSTTLFMLSLYVYCLLHCKLTKRNLCQWKKSIIHCDFFGNKTRNENKETKQDSFLLLFSSLLFAFFLFVNFFGFLMWEHTSLFILSKKKKKRRFFVKGWGVGNNSCGGLSRFCYGAPQNCKCLKLVRSPSH